MQNPDTIYSITIISNNYFWLILKLTASGVSILASSILLIHKYMNVLNSGSFEWQILHSEVYFIIQWSVTSLCIVLVLYMYM